MTYPILEWTHENDVHMVKMNGQSIADIRGRRFLRFTSKDGDARWIGPDWNGAEGWNGIDWSGIDLCCWGFHDPLLSTYENRSIEFEDHPDEGWFRINILGGKPGMECRCDTWLKGIWREQEGCFGYEFSTEYEGELEELYRNSTRCQKNYERDPAAPADIQVFDYFVSYTSWMDILYAREFAFPRPLYPWFLMSENGTDWVKSPMVHIPVSNGYSDKEGELTVYPKKYGTPGSFFGFADPEYGGWMTYALETPAPISHQICWMFYDVHVHAYDAVPPRGSCERIRLRYAGVFTPLCPENAARLLESAREYDWRTNPLYDVPRFSCDNRFDDVLNTLPGESIDQMVFWCKSDSSCRMDHTIGCGDTHSAMICRENADAQPSAWYCMTWGVPYDAVERRGFRWRMSAMIRTENCTGKARIGKVSMVWGGDIFYGCNTHYPDGEPKPHGGTFGGMIKELDLHWAFSQSVTGTADWTPVSFEFDALDGIITVFLELSGDGRCWFDNVTLEKLGPAERLTEGNDYRLPPDERTARFVTFRQVGPA